MWKASICPAEVFEESTESSQGSSPDLCYLIDIYNVCVHYPVTLFQRSFFFKKQKTNNLNLL